MLLEVILAGSHELDSNELVAITLSVWLQLRVRLNIPTSLESRDDRRNEPTLPLISPQPSIHSHNNRSIPGHHQA
jgi:hypothetical protein